VIILTRLLPEALQILHNGCHHNLAHFQDVGYFDSQTFRELFKKVTGLTPLEYKEKYKGHAAEFKM
jgi:methylphosphotriester-DNA--protein-cysteine methyltransferase